MKQINNMLPVPKCEKCGEIAPIDKARCGEKYTAYKINEPCKCGGGFILNWSNAEKAKEEQDA